MPDFIHRSICPICNSSSTSMIMTVVDHTVSNQTFPVWQCYECSVRFTQDVPDKDLIHKYYKSENYISHSDTQSGLVNKLYHYVRGITLKSKARLITSQSGLRSGSLLDIGAGTGSFLLKMHQLNWHVTGIEPDEDARAIANKKTGLAVFPVSELFLLKSQSFDVITLWHVLEHVHDLHETIKIIKQLLKPGGVLIVAVPNYTSTDARKYDSFWAAYDVPRHLYHFSPNSMKILLEKHSFSLTGTRPMWFDSFYVSLLSEKYRGSTFGFLTAFMNGLSSNLACLKNNQLCSSLIYIAHTDS